MNNGYNFFHVMKNGGIKYDSYIISYQVITDD